MTNTLSFPPLMYGEAAPDDAFDHAQMRAITGCDAGLISYALGAAQVQAALVFAPEVPLKQAMAMLPLCGVGFQNALGALAPPEVALHLEWPGGLRVNGAKCGRLRALASGADPDQIPDWLIVGFELPLLPQSDTPGDTPDETALYAEGCADVSPDLLVEAWARHTMNWITHWEDEGPRSLHAEWRAMAHGIGEPIHWRDHNGSFVGVDENFGLLLRDDHDTRLLPLHLLLETNP
jgi:biotin-(acetyl-CoA carboxylase) ligase